MFMHVKLRITHLGVKWVLQDDEKHWNLDHATSVINPYEMNLGVVMHARCKELENNVNLG